MGRVGVAWLTLVVRLGVAWLTITAIGGCAGLDERASADRIAGKAGMTPRSMDSGGFRILTYARGLEPGGRGPVHVYLEGDGRAWFRRPPRDPTAWDPVGLNLAARDAAPAVLWVARPCMYLDETGLEGCDVRYWTSHRYSGEVVEALDDIVTRRVGDRPVVLLGHSGGGALAVLLAARRERVLALVTVAAPLDLAYWTREEHLTPLHGSLNPADVVSRIRTLPQHHYCGGKDRVVPAEVVRRFVASIPRPTPARLIIREGYDHRCCWEREWSELSRLSWVREEAGHSR